MVTRARSRSQSLADDIRPTKRQKISTHEFRSVVADPTPYFASGLLSQPNVKVLTEQYRAAQPWKHVVIDKIFTESLLTRVKDEILEHLSFTEKETDIYKVLQTGDLASLNYLDEKQLALFPSLQTLRDCLYSAEFRKFIRQVTGCGPLSARRDKQDMSVNSYKKTCHLLNHDDVIGTRRVSYILYMPLPIDQPWLPQWGGALELYPVVPGSNPPEPATSPSKSVPPSWGQWVMFEVQPGKSFHSVEEVVIDTDEGGRQRLSISGWFHRAQPGEEDYEDEGIEETVSSRNQLFASAPLTHEYALADPVPLPDQPLSQAHTEFLANYLNPVYLAPKTLKALAKRFVEESSLDLHRFLKEPLAEKLRVGLIQRDDEDGLGPTRARRMPSHNSGTAPTWIVKGPPHKQRYCILDNNRPSTSGRSDSPSAEDSPDRIMKALQTVLFPSPAFRAWLAAVTSLIPMKFEVEARRFRPGLDYTLAMSEDKEARLDVSLGLTPTPPSPHRNGYGRGKERENLHYYHLSEGSWESGEWGGWECYLAPPEGDDDPAVYRSSRSKKEPIVPTNGKDQASHTNEKAASSSKSPSADSHAMVEENGQDGMDHESEASDDGDTLLTVQPDFNRLLLVLRDERVMRFVKYLSASAQGSRWDVYGEWEIGMPVDEEEHDSQ